MTDTQLLTMAGMLVATMFGLLATILGWLGNKVYAKIEEITATLHNIASELHSRITNTTTELNSQIASIDHRLTVVETRCNSNHERE